MDSAAASRTLSRRTVSAQLRQQRTFQSIRTALSVEASSTRYANMILTDGEVSIPRGWDVEMDEDEDGT